MLTIHRQNGERRADRPHDAFARIDRLARREEIADRRYRRRSRVFGLTKCHEPPDVCGESNRLDTMPSQLSTKVEDDGAASLSLLNFASPPRRPNDARHFSTGTKTLTPRTLCLRAPSLAAEGPFGMRLAHGPGGSPRALVVGAATALFSEATTLFEQPARCGRATAGFSFAFSVTVRAARTSPLGWQ